LMFSTSMLLVWLAQRHQRPALKRAAGLIDQAIFDTLATPQGRTPDLGGKLGTRAFGAAVRARFMALAK
jgi:3-isopropylmalate dehydrogenase